MICSDFSCLYLSYHQHLNLEVILYNYSRWESSFVQACAVIFEQVENPL